MATIENLEIIIQLFHLGVQIKCRDYPMPQPFFREREWFVRNHATNIQKEKKASPFINLKHTHTRTSITHCREPNQTGSARVSEN